jgi:ABC-2 type transport system permease protein
MFAVYKKELQSYFCSPLAYAVSAVFILIFSFSFIDWILNLKTVTFSFSFATIFYNRFYYLILLIPALTMKCFAEERKNGTEVLLMSAPLNVFKITMGKFLALATVYLCMIVLTFIFPVIAFFTGEVVWSELLCGYIGFFFWGLVCISLGMLMSSFTENQIIAAVLGEAVMIGIMFVDTFAQNSFVQNNETLYKFMDWLSPQQRFYGFSKGIFSLDDIIFYITIIAVVLVWNMISIEKRRWSRG